MAPRSKSHRTLSANNRTHSTASLHKPHHGTHLAGLTTLAKDSKAPSTRDTLVKTKKHSSSSSALSAKRNTSRTNVARAAPTRTTSSDKHPNAATKEDLPTKPNTEDEGWVSSESGAATPADQGVDNEEDDDDDELDEEEILQLQTQRAKRNAREAERLRAAMLAAEAELRAQRDDASRTPPTRESPQKHTNMGPALPPSGELNPQLTAPKPHSQTNQPPPTSPLAPVTQQPYVEDHTKHTFPTQHTPSPPAPVKTSTRDGPRSSEPIPYDYGKSNGDLNGVTLHPAEVSRPGARRSNTHAPRPVSAIMSPLRVPQAPTRSATTRPHPLIRAPSILTKATPAVPPLTAPPYLSAHSAQAQISSSPPPKTPSSASTKSSPAHTRQPSISSSIHTLPTLQVSPTAPLSASVSSLPHSPQQRASSLYHHPTTSLSPTVATNPIRETSRERERTISAVSSTAALHALAHHHPLKHPNQTRSIVQASTFPPEPADTYVGGMYGGGAGAGVYVGTGTSGGYSHAVVGGSGGMYGGKPGPVHALLPAPYMATHMSVGRWYAPAREAVARIVRGKGSP